MTADKDNKRSSRAGVKASFKERMKNRNKLYIRQKQKKKTRIKLIRRRIMLLN